MSSLVQKFFSSFQKSSYLSSSHLALSLPSRGLFSHFCQKCFLFCRCLGLLYKPKRTSTFHPSQTRWCPSSSHFGESLDLGCFPKSTRPCQGCLGYHPLAQCNFLEVFPPSQNPTQFYPGHSDKCYRTASQQILCFCRQEHQINLSQEAPTLLLERRTSWELIPAQRHLCTCLLG